jgi:hypothetical protein
MQDADLFMELAGIAGVFVGFGALIAVRSGGPSEAQEVTPVRGVVMLGMMTVIGALAPVTIGRYDLTDHQVLALSSVLVLVGSLGLTYLHSRTPEFNEAMEASTSRRSRAGEVVEMAAWVLLVGGAVLALIIVMLGLLPDLEAALYFTVLALILLLATWALLELVFMQRRPLTSSDPAEPPATGGSSA